MKDLNLKIITMPGYGRDTIIATYNPDRKSIQHIAQGKSPEAAKKNAAKVLRDLAKECLK